MAVPVCTSISSESFSSLTSFPIFIVSHFLDVSHLKIFYVVCMYVVCMRVYMMYEDIHACLRVYMYVWYECICVVYVCGMLIYVSGMCIYGMCICVWVCICDMYVCAHVCICMCDVCDVYMCCVCMCMCVTYSRPRLMLGFTVNCIFTIFMETDRVSQSYQELGNMASLASHHTLGEFFVSISIAVTYW